MIKRLLIANRGEIACRVMDTARRLGIETLAVYSEADRDALHVREADLAECIGPAAAADSYLNVERILAVARDYAVDAIHPGYGFLSENAPFAQAVTDAGIRFVGPGADAIRLMGDKAAARQLMAEHGVPVLPGFDREGASDTDLVAAASETGFPLLIKAVAGGGGKGMRVVNSADAFEHALAAARREARAAFGDDRVLLERYLASARHVEVQVFADSLGNVIHLFERDCSIQRRHQKIIEEAPAPGLDSGLRAAMGEAAVRAARAINYCGAGTVEFLLAPDGEFYFMEMNTRLQVEHPVTECVTGQDLVAWQLAVAAGEPLPLAQKEVRLTGHAMEVRVYAEDPTEQFLPSTGMLSSVRWPTQLARVDTGFEQGDTVSRHYDPMLAKIIVHGSSREQARGALVEALRTTRLHGIRHNLAFLVRVLQCPDFVAARLDTRLLERWPGLTENPHQPDTLALAAALAASQPQPDASPWRSLDGWRAQGERVRSVTVAHEGERYRVHIQSRDGEHSGSVNDLCQPLRYTISGDHLALQWGDSSLRCDFDCQRDTVTLFSDAANTVWHVSPSAADSDVVDAGDAAFLAPMSGTVVSCHVAPGAQVAAGEAVITLEAMKMEHTLRAPCNGRVDAIHAQPGDQVTDGQALVAFEADSHD